MKLTVNILITVGSALIISVDLEMVGCDSTVIWGATLLVALLYDGWALIGA